MDLVARVTEHFQESARVKLAAVASLAAPIAQAIERMVESLLANGKIMACGNGGSAADAQHFAAELVNRFKGRTSHDLRAEFASLRSRIPTLWSRSYYAGSCGAVTEASVRRYIESQKGK